MEYLIICAVAFFGAGLTLFSGFGLGTLLMPVFGIFFPIEVAIALTAVVHFANNLIKLGFFYKHLNWKIILKFGIPSVLAAYFGAILLSSLSEMPNIYEYSLSSRVFYVSPVKLTIAVLLIFFSLMDLVPGLARLQFSEKYMPLGGALSGFFGGLSGNQGALRAAFLIRSGLSKEVFIGTGVVIACLIDMTRITVYSDRIVEHVDNERILLLAAAVASAFVGVFVGNRLFKKMTIKSLQAIVAVMLLIFAVILGAGII